MEAKERIESLISWGKCYGKSHLQYGLVFKSFQYVQIIGQDNTSFKTAWPANFSQFGSYTNQILIIVKKERIIEGFFNRNISLSNFKGKLGKNSHWMSEKDFPSHYCHLCAIMTKPEVTINYYVYTLFGKKFPVVNLFLILFLQSQPAYICSKIFMFHVHVSNLLKQMNHVVQVNLRAVSLVVIKFKVVQDEGDTLTRWRKLIVLNMWRKINYNIVQSEL